MSFHIPNPKLNKTNPHFGSKYADLAETLRVIGPFLGETRSDVQQTTLYVDGVAVFTTRLLDAEGKVVREVAFPFPTTGKAQELGSALTYCRRYGLALLFNLVGEEDDDGNAAQGPKSTTRKGTAKAKPAPKTKGTKPKTEATPTANPPGDQPGDEDWY